MIDTVRSLSTASCLQHCVLKMPLNLLQSSINFTV